MYESKVVVEKTQMFKICNRIEEEVERVFQIDRDEAERRKNQLKNNPMEGLTGPVTTAEPMAKPSMLMGSTAISFSHHNPRFTTAESRMKEQYRTSCTLGLLGQHKHETFKC